MLGFWYSGGLAASVEGAQRDGSGCHEAEGADEQARWNPAVSASGGGVRAASRWLVRLVAIPLNTARPSADPSWKEVAIRAAANPA